MKKFFLKISKTRLIKFSALQRGHRPRAMQVYLAVLYWLNSRQSLSLGVEYSYGRAKGCICYYKELKRFISRWTGLEHKQIIRYLRDFERVGIIYRDDKQMFLDGTIRPQFFLHSMADLRAKSGEQFLIMNMRSAGQKGFDIYAYLEQCMRADSHPGHPDQLKFKISRSTRWYRSRPTPQKPAFIPRIQKVTPIARDNPFPFFRMEKITTSGIENFTKKYQKQLCLIHNNRRTWVDWWKTKEDDSEYTKIQAGLVFSDRVLWHKGRLYRQKDPENDPYSYEFVPKKARSWTKAPDYGPFVPSVEQTRKATAESLGLSVSEYLSKLRQNPGNIRA